MLAALVVIVVTAAFLSVTFDLYAKAMDKTDPKPAYRQIPADDLIGKELRDVQH